MCSVPETILSRMCTAHLPTVRASMATRCQYRWEGWLGTGVQVNKFEQVVSDGHQVSLAGEEVVGGSTSDVGRGGQGLGCPKSDVHREPGGLNSEACIMGNGHVGLQCVIGDRTSLYQVMSQSSHNF